MPGMMRLSLTSNRQPGSLMCPVNITDTQLPGTFNKLLEELKSKDETIKRLQLQLKSKEEEYESWVFTYQKEIEDKANTIETQKLKYETLLMKCNEFEKDISAQDERFAKIIDIARDNDGFEMTSDLEDRLNEMFGDNDLTTSSDKTWDKTSQGTIIVDTKPIEAEVGVFKNNYNNLTAPVVINEQTQRKQTKRRKHNRNKTAKYNKALELLGSPERQYGTISYVREFLLQLRYENIALSKPNWIAAIQGVTLDEPYLEEQNADLFALEHAEEYVCNYKWLSFEEQREMDIDDKANTIETQKLKYKTLLKKCNELEKELSAQDERFAKIIDIARDDDGFEMTSDLENWLNEISGDNDLTTPSDTTQDKSIQGTIIVDTKPIEAEVGVNNNNYNNLTAPVVINEQTQQNAGKKTHKQQIQNGKKLCKELCSPERQHGTISYVRELLLQLRYENIALSKPKWIAAIPGITLDEPDLEEHKAESFALENADVYVCNYKWWSLEEQRELKRSKLQSTTRTTLDLATLSDKLHDLIVTKKSENVHVLDWIGNSVDEQIRKSKFFIRILMTAIFTSAIEEGKKAKYCINNKTMEFRRDLMLEILKHESRLELESLYALQAVTCRLGYPIGVLRAMFDVLYDEAIVSGYAFIKWEKSIEEPDGKCTALKQVAPFFVWLKEAKD